jgi:hypothetical protein
MPSWPRATRARPAGWLEPESIAQGPAGADMITVELEAGAYELVILAMAKAIEAGRVPTLTAEDRQVLVGVKRVTDRYRLTADRAVARSLRDWFAKASEVGGAIGDQQLTEIAGRAVSNIDAALAQPASR